MNIKFLQSLIFLALLAAPANAAGLLEPRLVIPAGHHHGPRVALTLDACTGQADMRILQALIDDTVPATVFATARWLKRNGPAITLMKAHPELFEIENHGARHLPAVDQPVAIYGIAAAGSPAAVKAEVEGGAVAVKAATGRQPLWFRGATGKYSPSSLQLVEALGERVAGYSLIADAGATLSAAQTARNIAGAHDGDVIIAHVNQPAKPAGLGVVEGVKALKARGFVFLKLEDAWPRPASGM